MISKTHFINIKRLFQSEDYESAYLLAKIGAEEANTDAQKFLGWFYLYGYGTEKNEAKGLYWLTEAAKSGNSEADFLMGTYFCESQDYQTAIKYLKVSASKGFAPAECRLAWLYLNGYGVKRDTSRAYHYYESAAGKGNLWAQRQLAYRLVKGEKGIVNRFVGLYKLIQISNSAFWITLKNVNPTEMQR